MRKLNNKGMTSIEVLLSFIVVVMLSVSMYTTISAYQNKQNIESFKEKIMTKDGDTLTLNIFQYAFDKLMTNLY